MRFFRASSGFLTGSSTASRSGSSKAKSSRERRDRIRFELELREGCSGIALALVRARAPAVSQASAPEESANDFVHYSRSRKSPNISKMYDLIRLWRNVAGRRTCRPRPPGRRDQRREGDFS